MAFYMRVSEVFERLWYIKNDGNRFVISYDIYNKPLCTSLKKAP
ncbi:MAG: hypothetical protein H6Q17_1185 [Bacteroidetes bacterium]|nr:hypothetical protein [Bacteroidota bacterium]